MKNHTDVLIFHPLICAGASQIPLTAVEKSHPRLSRRPVAKRSRMEIFMNSYHYDVIIIGAGVSGSAVARELARRERRIAVLERESDVCEGTSKANSGIVHAGYDAIPGTLKAKLNLLGNQMMEELSGELDFSFQRKGSFVITFEEEGKAKLQELYDRGVINGVRELKLLSGDEARRLEPGLSDEVKAALYAPTAGIVCPFGMNIALAENAAVNGVDFYLNTEVTAIQREQGGYRIRTGNQVGNQNGGQEFYAPIIVNAGGVYADALHNMVSAHPMHITPRRGEYCLFDKTVGNLVQHTVFQLPSAKGKGILVTPTVHGNLLAGPTAEDIPEKEGVNTTAIGMEQVLKVGARSVKNLPAGKVITSFAGLRAQEESGDFIIGEVSEAPGFFDVAGIASPGLSSAPAIGVYVAELIQEKYPALEKKDFISTRRGIPSMADASAKERQELIRRNPAYANVICRCELVTEGEILEAIHRPLGATTLDGIKRRTRAGMGRCQSGFCSPKVVEILARELQKDVSEISKSGQCSTLLTGYNKEGGA